MKQSLVLALCLIAAPAFSQDNPKEARAAAETYLNALTGAADDSGKALLLGGVTMTAQLFTIENWKVVREEPPTRENKPLPVEEKGDLKAATTAIIELDKAGKKSMKDVMDESSGTNGDDVAVHQLSEAEATKLLGPTQQKTKTLLAKFPLLSYVARVGKSVYWHKDNPMRPLLGKTHGKGAYDIVLHRYIIETVEGPGKTPRQWPLRLVRFTTDQGMDTGWKVLPASDWNGD